MSKIKFKATLIDSVFKIYINNILHLQLFYNRKNIILQSWKMSENWYRVQFVNKKGKILTYCEYDNFNKWKSILDLINKNLN